MKDCKNPYAIPLPRGGGKEENGSFLRAFLQKSAAFYCFPAFLGQCPIMDSAPVDYGDFERIDIRVGVVVDAKPFPEARKPAIRLWIDFGGALGVKRSSAQLTVHYKPDRLIGRQVCAVVNFPPRQIGPFVSEVLTLGMPDEEGAVVLIRPDFEVPAGGRLF